MSQDKPKPMTKRFSINVGGFRGDDKPSVPLKVPKPQIPSMIRFEKEVNAKGGLDGGVLDLLADELGLGHDNLPPKNSILNTNVPRTRSVSRMISGISNMSKNRSMDIFGKKQPSIAGKFIEHDKGLPSMKSTEPKSRPAQKLPSLFEKLGNRSDAVSQQSRQRGVAANYMP